MTIKPLDIAAGLQVTCPAMSIHRRMLCLVLASLTSAAVPVHAQEHLAPSALRLSIERAAIAGAPLLAQAPAGQPRRNTWKWVGVGAGAGAVASSLYLAPKYSDAPFRGFTRVFIFSTFIAAAASAGALTGWAAAVLLP